ncbi:MAG: SusC/RagA family TonB-linked outer membrane protein [Gemmatimonadetes bacterium]|nr:SusC/RagA family TonB-linked outer membrane protein [Gemmatimonadota bacterium]
MDSPHRARLYLGALAAATALALGADTALAQGTGTIRGSIVESVTERPLSSVQVSLVGTGRGALTNAAGNFLLLNVPTGTYTIRAELIGHAAATQEVTVAADGVAQVDLRLTVSAIAVDQIVVTGTAGATSKRTLGNSVTTVNAAEMAQQTAITSLTELLQSKTPGVQILTNSGTLGAAADIRIRGASSLTSTKPVVFIDGVRYNISGLGSFTPSGAGTRSYSGQTTSAFDFLNPNDIETIEVIKGPAAATLYGAEAANGVIQIITKKGKRGEQSVRWDVRAEYAQNEWALDIPDNYTTCDAARIAEMDAGGNPVWPGCQGLAAGTLLRENPLRDDPAALRNGEVVRTSVSARGGGDRYSFYFAADMNEENGVFYNNYSDRNSVRGNFSIHPNDWMDLTVTTAYAQGDLRMPVGDESAQGMLLSAFRGRPGRITANPLNSGWAFTRAEQANEYNNTTRSDRVTLGATANLAPLSWFRNRVTFGMDYTASLAQVLAPPGSVDAAFAGMPGGVVAQRVPRTYVYSFDYAGNVDRSLTETLTSTTSFGAQAVSSRYESLAATGTGLGAPDITLISAATTTVGGNSFSENKSLGFFLQEQLGWNNRLFVTGGVRADDNSSFGDSFDWIYYPKASVAWVASEEPFLAGILEHARVDHLKLRTAWGQAGQAPAPFSATQIYTVDRVVRPDGTVASALRPRSFGNPDLKAEHGSELEVGFDAGLFQERIGVEFTYYDKRMSDVIVAVGAPGSSGFGGTFYGSTGAVLRNLGETRNSGMELLLSATPLQRRNLVWDARVSLATNDNELVDFGDARTQMIVGGQSYGSLQRHREGYPLAGYWWTVPARDENGNAIPLTARSVQLDTLQYIGPSAPTREVGVSSTFTLLRDWRVFVLFDYKGGHYLYNYREYNRCALNLNCERVNDPSLADHPDRAIWTATNAQGYWVQPADFVKLRDLSLTYSLPSSVAQLFRAGAGSVTLAGHNLALFSDYDGIDPEVSGYGNRQFARADVYPVPMLRRVSLAMNFSF